MSLGWRWYCLASGRTIHRHDIGADVASEFRMVRRAFIWCFWFGRLCLGDGEPVHVVVFIHLVFFVESIICLCFQQALLVEVLGDDSDGLFDAGLLAVDVDLWLLRRLVWCADASELLDLSCSCLFVESLGVTSLSLFDGHVHEDLDEWQR